MKRLYSHGKLLLTGEYVVLDGAQSLAIPTSYGQSLTVKPIDESKLIWKSLDENNNLWFEDIFTIQGNEILKQVQNDNPISDRLLQILKTVKKINPKFLDKNHGYEINTQLEFPKNWGLGTSSTLIQNISNWANVNPYQLLHLTFGGSGYDIACANADNPITYTLHSENKRSIKPIEFNPLFKSDLYFVYLNQKQNSREGISQYRANTSDLKQDLEDINQITQDMIECNSLDHFQDLMEHHEQIISKIIKQKPIKQQLFKDFEGSIKSLGAWGGDFVLVASKTNPSSYFRDKGFSTIIEYDSMVLK